MGSRKSRKWLLHKNVSSSEKVVPCDTSHDSEVIANASSCDSDALVGYLGGKGGVDTPAFGISYEPGLISNTCKVKFPFSLEESVGGKWGRQIFVSFLNCGVALILIVQTRLLAVMSRILGKLCIASLEVMVQTYRVMQRLLIIWMPIKTNGKICQKPKESSTTVLGSAWQRHETIISWTALCGRLEVRSIKTKPR